MYEPDPSLLSTAFTELKDEKNMKWSEKEYNLGVSTSVQSPVQTGLKEILKMISSENINRFYKQIKTRNLLLIILSKDIFKDKY